MPGHFQFYCNTISEGKAHFDTLEIRHMLQVLRYKEGDEIYFTNGMGNKYRGTLRITGKLDAFAEIIQFKEVVHSKDLTLIVGILKNTDRQEWLVEKCTELGVSKIYFVKTTNSQRAKTNLERLQKVAVSALKQCHGAWLPEIKIVTWMDVLPIGALQKYIALIDQENSIRWSQKEIDHTKSTALLIGPEGDFTASEVNAALQNGFQPITLGSHILRTETAVIAAASVFQL